MVPVIEAAFLDAIRADPDSDGPRLIFADWLEDVGRIDRAESIRRHVAQANGQPVNATHLMACNARRRAELPRIRGLEWGEFHGGLIRTIILRRTDAVKDRLAEVFAAEPITRIIVLGGAEPDIRQLCQTHEMVHVRALSVIGVNLGRIAARALAESPYLCRLRKLRLDNCSIGEVGAGRLFDSPLITGLQSLRLTGNALRGSVIAQLAQVPFERLDELGLSRNRLGDEGVHALVHAPWLRGLSSLSLSSADLGPEAMASLALVNWFRLHRLILDHNPIGPDGVRELIRSRPLHELRQLTLSHTDLGNSGGMALASLGASLESLALAGNRFGNESIRAWQAAAFAPTLRALDLSHNRIGDAGLQALLHSETFRLQRLKLTRNRLTDATAQALLRHGRLDHLESLDLRENAISPVLAARLMRWGQTVQV